MGIFDFLRRGPKQLAPPDANIELTTSGDSLADAMGDLALRVAGESSGNVVCSGSSLVQAWVRVWAGARGTTRGELDTALGLKDEARARVELEALGRALDAASEHAEIRDANAVWVSRTLALESAWQTTWGDAVHETNFDDPTTVADTINGWVSEKTNGVIDNILSANQIDPQMVLALTNAIYFKAKWKDEFETSRTQDANFAGAAGTERVPMMRTNGRHACVATPDFELLRRPYVGGLTEMVLIKPREGQFDRVRDTLRYGAVRRALDATESVLTSLELPKFTLECTAEVDAVLRNRGVSAVYKASTADLSGIANDDTLCVGQTIHKARIEVDESGTEAAAATFIGMTRSGGSQPKVLPYEFYVDRPFLFFIIERTTQTPLFSGQIIDLSP